MNYPEIRFKNPWLLMNALDQDLRPAYEHANKTHLLDTSFIDEKITTYEAIWRPVEERIVHGMCELFDLEFRQNTIDIYVAPFRNSFSDPMTIATKYDAQIVDNIIAHELLHRLLLIIQKVSMERSNLETGRHYSERIGRLLKQYTFLFMRG